MLTAQPPITARAHLAPCPAHPITTRHATAAKSASCCAGAKNTAASGSAIGSKASPRPEAKTRLMRSTLTPRANGRQATVVALATGDDEPCSPMCPHGDCAGCVYPRKVNLTTDCTDGPGERTRLGYVRIWINGRRLLAHVHAWQLVNGPKPHGMELDHVCRNRWCRNPAHLELVTHRVNSQRAANRKLNQRLAEEIRASYVPRVVTQLQLAAKYGVSRRTIEQILNRNFYP